MEVRRPSVKFSVIVPAYNSQETLPACLSAIRASDFKDFELIVVDDGSLDRTALAAADLADQVIQFSENRGVAHAWAMADQFVQGEIIVNIDSDVVIEPGTLGRIAKAFEGDASVAAVTGLLSKEHPHANFSSQYKNLYMHYMFRNLPRNVTFLYGSVFAVRRDEWKKYRLSAPAVKQANDTEFGQLLNQLGHRIVFDNGLQVVHLKQYSLLTLIKNDFRVPFIWAQLFLRYKGWRQLGENNTGYAHSSRSQLLSVAIAPLNLATSMLVLFDQRAIPVLLAGMAAWFGLNFGLLKFMYEEKKSSFAFRSAAFTFLDGNVMFIGIVCGAAYSFFRRLFRRSPALS